MVKTKIISTIGPSSEEVTVLRKMIFAGMDVARLNSSHGNYLQHQQRINRINVLNKKYRRRIKILLDLQGYRIRVGKINSSKGIKLNKGDKLFIINRRRTKNKGTITLNQRVSFLGIKKGSLIYIDDGNIALVVEKKLKTLLLTKVIIPGTLKENKGINIPDLKFKFSGLTEKDKSDIRFGLRNNVDYIAQSFVQKKSDIVKLKQYLHKFGHPSCKIIAKIECRQGIRNLEQIINASDGIMIARGDMGVSIPIYEIAMVQKMIINKCKQRGKISITATQMLESMVDHHRPTRAEVTDVANAVLDGSQFLMLSAETAIGNYPVESVKMMNQIIKFTENSHKRNKL